MNERIIIERIYNNIDDIKKEQAAMGTIISQLSTDISWIKSAVERLNNNFESCKVCSHSDEIVENHNKLKKLVFELKDKFNEIRWTAAGISAGISIIILIIAFLYKLNST